MANRVHIPIISFPLDVLFVRPFDSTIKQATTAQEVEGNVSKYSIETVGLLCRETRRI
jgi:hypothetical protein